MGARLDQASSRLSSFCLPREVVVERDNGTVSLFSGHEKDGVDGVIRARRAGDVICEEQV